jgi:hypothetical protein
MKRSPRLPAAPARTVRASEIGSYLYASAWWYQRSGQRRRITGAGIRAGLAPPPRSPFYGERAACSGGADFWRRLRGARRAGLIG